MKRSGRLNERIASRDNLLIAFSKAARGCSNHAMVQDFSRSIDERLNRLSSDVRSGSVSLGPFSRFVVFDPKQRVIHAAPFQDRVLHHAIMNVCGPLFERGAVFDSYACRIGKGNRAALDRAVAFARRNSHFLKLDIRKYFDSVDHGVLKQRFRTLIKDGHLLVLLDRIVESYQTSPGRGLPIGTLTSQYFANFYLDSLDRYIKEGLRCGAYVRFMDDFALWDDNPAQLARWHLEIGDWLASALRLGLKEGTRLDRTDAGMEFLGFRIMPGRVLLGARARRRFRKRLTAYERLWLTGEMGSSELQRRVGSLIAHTNNARCLQWRSAVLAESLLAEEELV